jgi:hypothetical protein
MWSPERGALTKNAPTPEMVQMWAHKLEALLELMGDSGEMSQAHRSDLLSQFRDPGAGPQVRQMTMTMMMMMMLMVMMMMILQAPGLKDDAPTLMAELIECLGAIEESAPFRELLEGGEDR